MSAFASVWPVEGVLQAKVTLQAHTQGYSTEGLDAEYLGRTAKPPPVCRITGLCVCGRAVSWGGNNA